MKHKRIVFVLPDFYAGGAQRVLLMLAGGVNGDRFEPSIIVLNGQGPWAEKLPDGVPVVDLEQPSLRRALPALRRALVQKAPDVVVSTMGYLNLGVLLLKPFLDANTRFIVREANTPWSGAKGMLATAAMKLAYRMLYRRAACVISPSRRIAGELVRDFHVKESSIKILLNPVEEAQLRARSTPVVRAAGNGPRFVCVGRLSHQKGYDRLLTVMADHPADAHVTIFGEGSERGALEARLQCLNIEEKVTLAGFNANPAPWVAGADALLLPSRWEGLPNVALEALACGTPVIATPESGGIAEIAEAASPGAVTIVEMGHDFAAAMAGVEPNRAARPRPSLLPDVFLPSEVNAEFARLLSSVTADPGEKAKCGQTI